MGLVVLLQFSILAIMRAFIVIACFFAGAMAQGDRPNWWQNLQNSLGGRFDDVVDNVHEYRFEYHDTGNNTHLLMAISDTAGKMECHIVEIGANWEPMLKDADKLHKITEEIYTMITDGNHPETNLSVRELQQHYGDRDATQECFRHAVKILDYTPSFSK